MTNSDLEHERFEVLQLAKRFLIAVSTYDAKSFERQRELVLSMSTDGFRTQYDQLTAGPLTDFVTQKKVTSHGSIVDLTISTLLAGKATVHARVTVTVSNKDLKSPRVDRQELELSMVRTKSGWKVAGLKVLSTFA